MRDLLRGALTGLGQPVGGPPAAGRRQDGRRVAVPLLGSRCRAFCKDVTLDVMALEAALWLLSGRGNSDNLDVRRQVGSSNKDGARRREQGFSGGDRMARQR